MQVIKRNGNPQEISFDKITKRIRDLSYGLSKVDPLLIAKETINGIFDGIKTTELDLLSAEICATKTHHHPEYNKLGGRILVSNIIKTTFDDYVSVIQPLYENKIISEKFYNFVVENRDAIQEIFVYERDYLFDFFGMKTLERSYLFKINGKIMERPQHMWMRVAIQIHGFKENPIPLIKETYDLMSLLYFTHATPTLFNSGTNNPQLSSCFLLSTEDNIEDIFKSISDIAQISKWSGGIGLSLSTIRAKGSLIHGTNGKSEGIIPLCKTLEMVGRYINQGGKRQGSIACFCEDTEIFTINEGVKKIQDVKLGDLVVTHNNRVRPVIQFHKNPLGDRKIYKLKVERNKDVYVTGNHKFWSFHTKKYKDNKISVGWNSIEELKNIIDKKETTRTSCYISYPSNNGIETIKDKKIDVLDYKNIFNEFIKDFEIKDQKIVAVSRSFDRNDNQKIAKSQSINRFWNITEDFANLIGIWLGDGHIKKYKGKIFGIGFTVYKHNTNEINYIIKNCKEIFGCNVKHYASKTNNCINILVNSHMIASIFMELFGSGFAGKKLANMCFGWSKKMIYSLLAGLITTDGHITKKCNITLCLSNQKLMNELYHLCRNTGIDVSILKNKIQKGQTCDSYTMSIPLIKEILDNTYKYYTDDRYQKCYEHLEKDKKVDTFLKIISITETDRKDDFVYTLGIEEDHSYTVEGLLAQNCYLEPWHADIYSFIELRKNTGDENLRARDLFIALWIPDLFMKRIQEDGEWTLMCPNECKGLVDCYGEKFETLYISYEQEKKGKKVVKARDLWNHILENQIETGMPYISFKDSVNHKNMQKQLGTIRNSNLCVAPETMILTSTGYFPIKTLENQEIDIWNGEEFSKTVVHKTGENQKLITVKFSNGHTLDCTPYHKFYIKDKIVEAKDLQKDMEIIDFSYPVITKGFDVIINHQNSPIYVPINGSLHVKLVWLYEIFEIYGKIMDNKYYLELSADILERTSFLIQTLGCYTVIQENVLICSNSTMKKLLLLGLKTNFVVDVDDVKDKIYISEIVYKNRHSDTFCFKEQKRGMGIFNGILTGQCNEIALFSNKDNISVCNLSSICLPRFVKNKTFDFENLEYIAGVACRNLNNVIDVNFYPVPETKKTNDENRPIGIGIQGLSDVYLMLGLSFGSDEARSLNKRIFETIYFGSVKMSIELAKIDGPYKSIENSPHSEGLLQFDLWPNVETFYDWSEVKKDLKQYGIRNSLLTALMPTASTSQIMANNEAFEPYTSNIYVRKTLAGEFTVVNQHLINDLSELGLWNDNVYNEMLYDNGSVQNIKEIPKDIKDRYKTAYELKITDLLKQAVDRSPFIDHMQSMNLFMPKPDFNLLNSSHFYSWKNGLKTGMYYLRTQPAVDAIKFGLDPTFVKNIKEERKMILKNAGVEDGVCPRDQYLRSICESCSS